MTDLHVVLGASGGAGYLALGRPPRMRVIRRPMMLVAGVFSPVIRESVEVLYQFERPFVMDATKFSRAFGSRVTPHEGAVRRTIEGAQP